jgi:hypothetical protein
MQPVERGLLLMMEIADLAESSALAGILADTSQFFINTACSAI